MKKIILIFLFLTLLNSCGGFEDAGKVLRNEKTTTTDEFLVKKKEPLVFPPDYDKLPKPGTKESLKDKNQEDIKKILKAPNENNTGNTIKSSTVEDSILDRIRK